MKKSLSIVLSVVCLCMGVCFAGCDKTSVIPEGNYGRTKDNTVFVYTEGDIRNTYGWIIDGNTAEQWTSSVCVYKAKIIEKDGEIIFDGYRWGDFLDALFGNKSKQGSDHDYTVIYNEVNQSFTLTPKLPKENVEYVFDGITFEKSDNLKIEDLSNFIPMMQAQEIKTIKDFEELILDNLDTYSINVWESEGIKRIYFTPKYHSITVRENNLLLLTEKVGENAQEVSCTPITNGSRWDYTTENETFRWDSVSTFSYTISFPMEIPNLSGVPKYFRMVYNYKAK